MTIGFDKDDLDYVNGLGIFLSTSDGVRFAIKLMRLYAIPAIRMIEKKDH